MKAKTIRITNELMTAIELIKNQEKIEESTAMRKLIKIGFETYIGNLYKQGKVTLREAARLLNVDQIEAMNLFLDAGIQGNLDASDVMISLERFVFSGKKNVIKRYGDV